MEYLILAAFIVIVGAVIYVNRSSGLDVNGDGKVDLDDAKEAVKNTVEAVKQTADVNNDGKVDLTDVKAAAKTVATKAKTTTKKAATKAKETVKKSSRKPKAK
jgi:preprotein translocase subunit SecF